jgi:sec-independent protein translocase protein TatA
MAPTLLAFLRPTLGELLLIALVAALLFGTRRLPELGRALGSAIRNFQRSIRGDEAPPSPPDEKGNG